MINENYASSLSPVEVNLQDTFARCKKKLKQASFLLLAYSYL